MKSVHADQEKHFFHTSKDTNVLGYLGLCGAQSWKETPAKALTGIWFLQVIFLHQTTNIYNDNIPDSEAVQHINA